MIWFAVYVNEFQIRKSEKRYMCHLGNVYACECPMFSTIAQNFLQILIAYIMQSFQKFSFSLFLLIPSPYEDKFRETLESLFVKG